VCCVCSQGIYFASVNTSCSRIARFAMHRGERRQHLCIAVSGGVDPGHVMLAPAVVAMLQTAKRRHVRVQAAHVTSRAVPRTITLLPLVLQHNSSGSAQPGVGMDARSSGHEETAPLTTAAAMTGSLQRATARRTAAQKQHEPLGPSWLRSLTEAQMAQLLAAWLGAQARAAGRTEGSPVLVQVRCKYKAICYPHGFGPLQQHMGIDNVRYAFLPMQDGTVVALQHPDKGTRAHFGVRLQRGVPLDEGGDVTVLLRPADLFLQVAEKPAQSPAQSRVERGSAVPLQVKLRQHAVARPGWPSCKLAAGWAAVQTY
jgi:hypothetical protein